MSVQRIRLSWHVAHKWENRDEFKTSSDNLEGRDYPGNLDVDGRITLKFLLKEHLWIKLFWSRYRPATGCCDHDEASRSVEDWNFQTDKLKECGLLKKDTAPLYSFIYLPTYLYIYTHTYTVRRYKDLHKYKIPTLILSSAGMQLCVCVIRLQKFRLLNPQLRALLLCILLYILNHSL